MSMQKHLMKTCCCWSFIFFLYVLSISEALRKLATANEPTLPESIIIFGDSIVDTGNNNNLATLAKCDFAPYGKDFQNGKPTGRWTNGKTPADFLAETLGIKDLVPAYLDPNLRNEDLLTGVSFASGGTGYDNETARILSVLSFSRQLELFKEYIERLKGVVGEEEANRILRESLYMVVAVSNDLAVTYFTVGFRRLQYSVDEYTDYLVASASNFLQEIYKLGARKIGIFGAPPIGCLPFQRTVAGGLFRSCSEKQNKASQLYNTKLSTQLNSLNASLPESRVVYIDIYNPLNDIIQDPQKYGFDVVDRGCCATGTLELAILCNTLSPTCSNETKYLFWDSFHPTEQGYKVVVQRAIRENINKFL